MRKSYIAIKRRTTGDNNKIYTKVYMINHERGKSLFELVKEILYYSYSMNEMAVKFNTTSPEDILKSYANIVDVTEMVAKELKEDWGISNIRAVFLGLESNCGSAVVDITLSILGIAVNINYYFMRSKPLCLGKEQPYARRFDESDYLKSIDHEYSDFKLKMFKVVVNLVSARCIKDDRDLFTRQYPHLVGLEGVNARIR